VHLFRNWVVFDLQQVFLIFRVENPASAATSYWRIYHLKKANIKSRGPIVRYGFFWDPYFALSEVNLNAQSSGWPARNDLERLVPCTPIYYLPICGSCSAGQEEQFI